VPLVPPFLFALPNGLLLLVWWFFWSLGVEAVASVTVLVKFRLGGQGGGVMDWEEIYGVWWVLGGKLDTIVKFGLLLPISRYFV
jgi:hypothetical protein